MRTRKKNEKKKKKSVIKEGKVINEGKNIEMKGKSKMLELNSFAKGG